MRFENKVVLITGGGGGIGKAAARRFLKEGAEGVVLNSRRQEVLDAAKEELSISKIYLGDATITSHSTNRARGRSTTRSRAGSLLQTQGTSACSGFAPLP